ncbi:MAG TPA: hypothetical protein PKV21_07805 [bacterium]|nr:hypothetical protein [bacterium]HOM27394.1 hypothetical protein [bacterium]
MKKSKVLFGLVLLFVLNLFGITDFGYKFTPDKDILLMTEENNFLVQPQCIISKGNMLYFAAQDFTKNRELLIKKIKDVKVIKDELNRKILKVMYSLWDEKKGIFRLFSCLIS